MMRAIKRDEPPSFYFMQYEIVSPSPPQSGGEGQGEVARIKSPLSGSLPVSRGERVIITPAADVRERFKRVKPLKDIPIQMRGWTLDVLNMVRRLVESRRRGLPGRSIGAKTGDESLNEKPAGQLESLRLLTSSPTNEFTTADAYAFTRELEKLHPDNRHVKDKIRQQLQVLRDAGFLIHIGHGKWRLP